MINLDGRRIGNFAAIPVSMEGEWVPGPMREWRGQANAKEPFVAVLFLSIGQVCQWTRWERAGTGDVRLLLSPCDDHGQNVEVVFSSPWGWGHVDARTKVHSNSYRPLIPAQKLFQTGTVQRFARIDGDRGIDLLVLFLARSDVRSARVGLWQVRRHLMDSISNDWIRRLLTYGRSGQAANDALRPISMELAWLTTTVVSLSHAIYEENAFDRLPILADTLEEAGCTNAEILNHCRQPGPHARGCWVVDLILGKK